MERYIKVDNCQLIVNYNEFLTLFRHVITDMSEKTKILNVLLKIKLKV